MSMSKEDGWEDYFCHCGRLAGHYYVGFPPKKENLIEMKERTARSLCPDHREKFNSGMGFLFGARISGVG